MLSAAALAGFRNHAKNTVAYAKYKIGSTYYRSEITDITISSDGKVKIEFILNPSVSGEAKVQKYSFTVQVENFGGVKLKISPRNPKRKVFITE